MLTAHDAISDLLAEVIAASSARRGLDSGCECLSVVARTGEFAGHAYRITRELVGGVVDCSTLISQCMWIGAGAGVPFVAETQRLAYNAIRVTPEERLPGDVLVRYRSRNKSPDGRHNHVAMFIGEDTGGQPWLIESRAPHGVRARRFDAIDAEGGIRRFLPNPTRVFVDQDDVLRLARAVPKLGRLGARLTSGLVESPRHRGVDIYFQERPTVVSPLKGTLVYRDDTVRGRGVSAYVVSDKGDQMTIMRPIERDRGQASRPIQAGGQIGRVAQASCYGCNVIPGLRHLPRLHMEYWAASEMPYVEERGIDPIPSPRKDASMSSYNAIYAIKLHLIGAPISRADTATAVRLPLSDGVIGVGGIDSVG